MLLWDAFIRAVMLAAEATTQIATLTAGCQKRHLSTQGGDLVVVPVNDIATVML